MAKLRKLTKKLCSECIYMPGTSKNGCNYMSLTGHSRVFKGRDKVVPDGYCDKFQAGKKLTNIMKAWRNDIIYSDKGGILYDKNYRKYIDSIDSYDADG